MMKTKKKQVESTQKRQLLSRKKTDPRKFVFTGRSHEGAIDMQLFRYNEKECIETKGISHEAMENFDQPDYQYWLNIYGLHIPDSIAELCQKLKIHDLVIQDILDVYQRPKYQEFDNFAFLTIKSIVPSDTETITEQISFISGKNFIISFQEHKADYFEHLRYRLRENIGILRGRGPDYMLFTMLEAIMDNYFQTLQKLEGDLEIFNPVNLNTDPSLAVFNQIEKNKRHVHLIRKAIYPIKEFILIVERAQSKFIESRHIKYFLEIKDLCLTLLDSCDTIEHSLESSTNLFFSVQGHKMNLVMKTLTIVATIFIPLTFITGIYGMNFYNMPELTWKYGYLAIWSLILVAFLGMMYYLKKRKWF
jgi:magnesium transporter